jgi:serine/threonine protein kinase
VTTYLLRCHVCGMSASSTQSCCPSCGNSLDDATAVAATPIPLPLPASRELQPGTTVGEYRIEGKLGQGGMGTVYAAVHPLIGKKAAIKVISTALSADTKAVERFVQEARAVNQIGHPNIVDVFSFGTLPDGRCYFAMEWLRGETLAARIGRGPLPHDEAAAILDQVCRALSAVHEKGIVHRDLKPANIFLAEVRGERPQVKLLDFGVAKLVTDDVRLERTQTGAIIGTPLYMSPEQAKGHGVDGRADIYSLGCMAYEIFVGRAPFTASSAVELLAKHLHAEPDPPSTFGEIRSEMDRVLHRTIAKDPAARPSLDDLRAALIPRINTPDTRPVRSRWTVGLGVATAAIGLVALTVAVIKYDKAPSTRLPDAPVQAVEPRPVEVPTCDAESPQVVRQSPPQVVRQSPPPDAIPKDTSKTRLKRPSAKPKKPGDDRDHTFNPYTDDYAD